MEFSLGLWLHISNFDNLDFYQLEWKYERLKKHIKELNARNNPNVMDGSKFG